MGSVLALPPKNSRILKRELSCNPVENPTHSQGPQGPIKLCISPVSGYFPGFFPLDSSLKMSYVGLSTLNRMCIYIYISQGQKTALAVAAGAAATLASTVPGCHWGVGFRDLGSRDFG